MLIVRYREKEGALVKTLQKRILYRCLFALCMSGSIVASAAPPPMLFGMCASVRDGKETFEVMKKLGVRSIRADAPWKEIEISRGQYTMPGWVEDTVNEAKSAGMEPLLILGYGNPLYVNDKPRTPEDRQAFARYAAYVVDHFKGRVRYFELFNEWETHTGATTPGSPEDFIELAKITYPAVKGANPNATLITAGIADLRLREVPTGWIADFLKRGGMNYVDGLSLHPYNTPGDNDTPEYAMAMVDTIYDLAKKSSPADKSPSIYLTEMGYPSYGGRLGVSESDEANYLARFLLLAASRAYIRAVWWYNLRDGGVDPTNLNQHFGLVYPDFRPKPAGRMYSAISNLLSSAMQVTASVSGDTYTVTIRRASGNQEVTWSKDHSDVQTHRTESPDRSQRLIELGKLSER